MFILSTSIYVFIQTSGFIDTFPYKIHEIFNFVSLHGTHTLFLENKFRRGGLADDSEIRERGEIEVNP